MMFFNRYTDSKKYSNRVPAIYVFNDSCFGAWICSLRK